MARGVTAERKELAHAAGNCDSQQHSSCRCASSVPRNAGAAVTSVRPLFAWAAPVRLRGWKEADHAQAIGRADSDDARVYAPLIESNSAPSVGL